MQNTKTQKKANTNKDIKLNKYLPHGMSVYPPNTYCPAFTIVTVLGFPSHLLWKVLTDQP